MYKGNFGDYELTFNIDLILPYQSRYSSVNPSAIAATMVSTAVAVVYCKVMDGKRRA